MKAPIAIVSAFIFISSNLYSQSFETLLQQGHELAVIAVAKSPDSNYVATGSRDKSAKLWELHTGREVRSFLGHDFSVTAVAFANNGKTLVTGSNDKSIKLWDVVTGQELASIVLNYRITSIAVAPDSRYAFVGGYQTEYVGRKYEWDDSVVVVDLKAKRVAKKINANPDKGVGYGTGVAVSPDGKYLAVGEDNRVTIVYSTGDWKQVNKFEVPEGFCGGCGTRVTFSPDSKHLYMVSNNGAMKKYKVTEGTLEKTYIEKLEEDLTDLQVSPNGKILALGTEQKIFLIDEATGKEITSYTSPERVEVHQLAFSANGRELLITSDDNTLHRWDFNQNKDLTQYTGILNMRDKGGLNYDANSYWDANIAKYVRFRNKLLLSADGKTLIKGKFGTKVKRWDVASGKTVMEYVGHNKAVLAYDLSADGKKLLTGGGDGKIILWDVETGDSLKTIASYREPIFDIQFNADETKVLSSSWDASMKIHDLETTALEHYFDFQTNSAYNVMFHPNDLYVFSARLDNSVQMWEIDTQAPVRTFVGHKDIVSSLAMSPDQKSLMTASWDGSIRLWDIGTGLMTKKYIDHHGAAHVAIFSPDGKFIFSGGADREIRMWDVNTAKVVKTFDGHRGEVTSLSLSTDNKMLISHSVDGATKFWDLQSGREFFEHIHFGDKDWMVKNPEGYFNGTDGARQHIHFVDGMKTYAVDQFFEEFYRPDLLPKIFQNRGGNRDDLKGIQGKLENSPPPSLKVAIIPSQEVGRGDLYVRITDAGGGVENLKIYHNGKSLAIDRSQLQMPTSKQPTTTYKLPVSLISGNNVFTATASNKDRVESTSPAVEYLSDHIAKNSVCYILAVGINQYKNPRMTLNYARPDAQSFVELMEKKGTLFKNVELHSLYDQEASRANILKKLDELSAIVHPEDVFVFYYAGHGSMVDNQFYFIPTESIRLYDASSLKTEAIEATVLQDKLKDIRALKQLIIMDACQSGGSVELLATRGASEEKAIAQLSRSAGIHVMASAGSDQFATEFTELGHGLFTYLLLKALQGDADGAPKDGKVTIYELKSYLDDQVPEMTRKMKGKPQYPYTFSRGQDFPVAVDK
jgi:WD40 repeat protein